MANNRKRKQAQDDALREAVPPSPSVQGTPRARTQQSQETQANLAGDATASVRFDPVYQQPIDAAMAIVEAHDMAEREAQQVSDLRLISQISTEADDLGK